MSLIGRVQARVAEISAAFKAGDWGLGLTLLGHLQGDVEKPWPDEELDHARRVIEEDYVKTRDRIAGEVAHEWRSGEFQGSRDAVMESIEQSCDAACTYTVTAQLYLTASRNEDAYVEEFGEIPVSDGDIPWSLLAAWALRADVLDALKRDGIDVDQRPPDEPQVECSRCDEWKPGEGDVCDDCKEDEEDDDQGLEDGDELAADAD